MTWRWRNAAVHHQTNELPLGPAHGLTLDRHIFGLYYRALALNPASETQLQSLWWPWECDRHIVVWSEPWGYPLRLWWNSFEVRTLWSISRFPASLVDPYFKKWVTAGCRSRKYTPRNARGLASAFQPKSWALCSFQYRSFLQVLKPAQAVV